MNNKIRMGFDENLRKAFSIFKGNKYAWMEAMKENIQYSFSDNGLAEDISLEHIQFIEKTKLTDNNKKSDYWKKDFLDCHKKSKNIKLLYARGGAK